MKRIAFVHNNFPAGGAERITIDIARYLKNVGGYQVYVYTTMVSPSLMTDEVRELVNIRTIPNRGYKGEDRVQDCDGMSWRTVLAAPCHHAP